MKKQILITLSLCCAFSLIAKEPVKKTASMFTWGGDLRLREVYFDNIPYSNGQEARGGVNHFQRYRIRLWGDYQAKENLMFRMRLVNEFFTYEEPNNKNWHSPDELVFDNLFIDWFINNWSIRIGRQDLIYGTGKLILDGTPKDGSRTIYFDAIKASYTGLENTSIDFLLLHTQAKDPLAIHSEDRDIVGYSPGNAYEGSESGGGVYIKNSSNQNLPFEAYYFVKTHGQKVGPINNRDRHTVGTRLMPKFSDAFDGNLELAYQLGNDISAYMIDAAFYWHIQALTNLHATMGMGWYHLSGDKLSSSHRDEGWSPLWGRWPQYSELYIYAYDVNGAGRWSNISSPHIDFTFNPTEKITTSLMIGYLFAPEADGAGGGHNRGFITTLNNQFAIKEQLLCNHDKLTVRALFEVMKPDGYYKADQRHTALFARLELDYSF